MDHRAVLAEALREEEMTRRAFLRRLGATALVAGATGVFPRPAAARPPRRGGTLKVAWIDTVDTLDPHATSSLGAGKITNNIYNAILKVDYDGKRVRFVPDLAEKWEMPDPVTHILTLRRGVKFHTGEEFTAEDVKWNQERLADKQVGSPHGWKLAYLDEIQILAKHKIKITFSKPYQFLQVAWNGSTGRAGTIVSRRAVEKHGRAYGRHPVGTGPFRLVEWVENNRIVLERHREYFEMGADGRRLPYLDKVTILLVREAATALGAIMTGEIDGMGTCPFPFVAMLRNNPNLTVYGQVEGNYTYLGMNNRKPPFDDKTLRQAVSFAIDRTPIIHQAYFGEAIQACTPISPPMTDFYNASLCGSKKGQAFDVEKAKALRAKAKVQGEIEVDYMTTAGATGSGGAGTRVAELVQPMLAKIGITARIQLFDQTAWLKKRNTGDFQMYDGGWIADLHPDQSLFSEWHSEKPWNFVGYSNPEYDRLVTEAQFETNLAKRKALYEKASMILAEDAPCAFLTHFKEFKVLSKRVKNFQYIPADLMNFHDVWI
ncbi:MAG: ABC transporter substrate-binding protein [candidate division NC10 bacterium]|nr:ABC transporter substrate-binding protein [candidate division NC10 bacterium]